MNLYQEILAVMDEDERRRFKVRLAMLVCKELKQESIGVFELLANVTQDQYDEALNASGLPLACKANGTLFVL